MRIPKESRHGQGWKVGGQKHVRLIAIDYHAATSTAGTGYRGDRRLKMARQPESGTDSGGLTKDTRDKDLSQSKRGARESKRDR